MRAGRGRSQEGRAAEEGAKVAPGVHGWGSGHKMGARANGGREGWAGRVKGAGDMWRSPVGDRWVGVGWLGEGGGRRGWVACQRQRAACEGWAVRTLAGGMQMGSVDPC